MVQSDRGQVDGSRADGSLYLELPASLLEELFGEIRDGRFVERTAVNGATYENLRLYEQPFEPERFQFYRMVDIPFARELRKVAVDHSFNGLTFAGSVGE